jgi:hypothetical protein
VKKKAVRRKKVKKRRRGKVKMQNKNPSCHS